MLRKNKSPPILVMAVIVLPVAVAQIQPNASLFPPEASHANHGIEGTDLGDSIEHSGRVYFLFGDTVGRLNHALDTIATTDAADPERGVRLDFLMSGRRLSDHSATRHQHGSVRGAGGRH
jgi:hypothetical protein